MSCYLIYPIIIFVNALTLIKNMSSSIAFAFGVNSIIGTGTEVSNKITANGNAGTKRYLLVSLDEMIDSNNPSDTSAYPTNAEQVLTTIALHLSDLSTTDANNIAVSGRRFSVNRETETIDNGFFLTDTKFTNYRFTLNLYNSATVPTRPPYSGFA